MNAPAPTRDLKAKIWKRDSLDFYVEEPRASRALFNVEGFIGSIWDPACGQGNIVRSAILAGIEANGSDIVDRFVGSSTPSWWRGEIDFLTADLSPLPNIVCNPPFFRGKGTEAFIRKALKITYGKVAMFADLTFLASEARASGLWTEHPPHRVYVVTPRVSCPPGEYIANGGKVGGGTADWAWFVWDRSSPFLSASATTLHWLRTGKQA